MLLMKWCLRVLPRRPPEHDCSLFRPILREYPYKNPYTPVTRFRDNLSGDNRTAGSTLRGERQRSELHSSGPAALELSSASLKNSI